MKLVLISYPDNFEGETQIVAKLLKQFDFTFHLRKPGLSSDDYRKYLEALPASTHEKIVLHDAHELSHHYKVKGLHYSSGKRLGNMHKVQGLSYSTSCHSLEEVVDMDDKYDYVFLSPVFPSISKKGYKSDLDLCNIRGYLKSDRQTKVIALGGIDKTKINALIDCSFDGLALLGAVWTDSPERSNEIVNNFKEIYTCLKKDHIV